LSDQLKKPISHHKAPERHIMKNNLPRTFLLTSLAMVFAPVAFAQPKPLETAAGWKTACETSPGNRVILDQDITVSPQNGALAVSADVVSGCVIELRNDASLQLDRTTFKFGGALIIVGGVNTELAMDRAEVTAPSVDVTLAGEGNQVRMKESRINARQGGNLNLTLGSISKMEISGQRRNYEGNATSTNAALYAEGDLNITVGTRFAGSMGEGNLFANRNLNVRSTGGEIEMKFENVVTYAPKGAVAITIGGGKSKLEYSNAPFTAGTDVDVVMNGAETSMSFSNSSINAKAFVELHASGEKGSVKVSNGYINAPGAFLATAGMSAAYGEVMVEGATITGGTSVGFASGSQGSTLIKSSSLNSTASVTATAGAGGKCEAVSNRVTSPSFSICQ
jgi:hypothetical protein